jgi:hypothetical protein
VFQLRGVVSKREWDTPLREPWNPVIAQALKAIDLHVACFLTTGEIWHLTKAHQLREYVRELKDWINRQECG